MTPPHPPRRGLPVTARILLLTFATFLVGTNGFVIAGLLPDIAAGLDTDTAGVGVAISVYAGIVAVLAPTVATLLGGWSRTALMAGGTLLVGAGTALTAVAPDLTAFIAGRAIAAIGGAAIVPTAAAAAASLVPPERRGRAIGLVALGFTLATAIGSPLGTAVAEVGGWQLPLAGVAVLSVVSAAGILAFVRDVPLGPRLSPARQVGVLARPGILLALLATVFSVMGFNIGYLYSSTYTAQATGGSGALLALLLLLYGLGGVVGNLLAGRLTDRLGNRIVAALVMGAHVVILTLMPLAEPSLAALGVAFAVWGVAAFGAGIPIQHRLVALDPDRAAASLSWYSTALYAGIALAPVAGETALAIAGPSEIPHAAAIAVLVALVLFQSGYLAGRPGQDAGARSAA